MKVHHARDIVDGMPYPGEYFQPDDRVYMKEDVEKVIGNLLAVIHGDGGQYQGQHGIEKSCADAEKVVNELRRKLDEAESQVEAYGRLCNALQEFVIEFGAGDGFYGQDPVELVGDLRNKFETTESRRAAVKGLTCHHKSELREDDDGSYWVCEKNDKECLVDGRCPSG